MGIKVTKINRVMRCKQNDYIWKEYRKSNAKKGTEAITLNFRKTNNILLGRFCMNIVDFCDAEFLHDDQEVTKSVSRPTCKNASRYDD